MLFALCGVVCEATLEAFTSYCYCYYDYKNMTTFLPNPLSSIFLSFGKRRQAWPRSSKCHRLTSYSFVRSSFVWKSFRKRSATLQSFPVDTIQADQIANTSFAQCESNNKSNNKSNNTHHFSIQSFIEIPSLPYTCTVVFNYNYNLFIWIYVYLCFCTVQLPGTSCTVQVYSYYSSNVPATSYSTVQIQKTKSIL